MKNFEPKTEAEAFLVMVLAGRLGKSLKNILTGFSKADHSKLATLIEEALESVSVARWCRDLTEGEAKEEVKRLLQACESSYEFFGKFRRMFGYSTHLKLDWGIKRSARFSRIGKSENIFVEIKTKEE